MLGLLLIAALTLPFLLYLPGWLLSRAFAGALPADPLDRHYERVVVSTLLNGWLALLLAEFGIFSLWLHLGVVLVICAALIPLARRHRLPPAPDHADRVAIGRWSFDRRYGEALAFALVGAIALLLVIRPFEIVLGVRDAGVYANAGFAIARTGGIVQSDALVAELGQAAQSDDPALRDPAAQALTNFLGVQHPQRYIATRLRAAGFFINEGEAAEGRVTPQGLHLLPAWIGLLTSAAGYYGGLFAPGLMGLLGAWSVGMLGRRLIGTRVGLLAFLLLALNGVQVWFARYSTAETTAQFLAFAGLHFFATSALPNRNPASGSASTYYAALAGIAIGQVALARIDFFLLAPMLIYLLYSLVIRRWSATHTALAAGLGLILLHAGLHIVFIARAYFFDTAFNRLLDYAVVAWLAQPFLTPTLREVYHTIEGSPLADSARLWRELAVIGAGLVALLAIWRWPRPLQALEDVLKRQRSPLLALSAGAIVLLAGYAYFVRPQIIDADILFNTRGGWSDPLERDPLLVQQDVNAWRMTPEAARAQAGVVLEGPAYWAATKIDWDATAALREQLRTERGAWAGPFSNQTFNWMRLQGYVGAPIALPRIVYDTDVEWWSTFTTVPEGVDPPPGIPVKDKYAIPLANMVRLGWYLSPLGVILGVVGFGLWWARDMNRGSWPLLLIALVGTLFYVRQTYGTSDQTYIYILRRFATISYPALSLSIAYALVVLADWRWPGRLARLPLVGASGAALLLVAFFVWTNRPIYAHTEYAGAVQQVSAIARRFTPASDVVLLRGGAPTYAEARDVPDLLATPLRLMFGIDALTVKSNQPGAYADALAAQTQRWIAEGRAVYLALSASGGSFTLPGFELEPVDNFALDLPEFEQLTDQKPRNVARLALPFQVYRLVETTPNSIAAPSESLAATDFAAQVHGFYLPETGVAAVAATNDVATLNEQTTWTNGNGILRLNWPRALGDGPLPAEIHLRLAPGQRPAHLGPAEVCLALQPETTPWPTTSSDRVELGCLTIDETLTTYTLALNPRQLPVTPTGSMLLYLTSDAWVPAEQDPQQNDRRSVGVQFAGLAVGDAAAP